MSDRLRDAVQSELISYRCQFTRDNEGDSLALVDVLSPDSTIKQGKLEIELLADAIACAVENAVAAAEQAALEEALELLRECEWTAWGTHCPICERYPLQGHAPDCRLAALLRRAKP
ncbi:hypothetical protein HQ520_02630 [bacterium]|nr:hypothetical protein [bacterium]